MTTEENKRRDRQLIEEVFNAGNFERLEEFVSPTIANHLRLDIGGMLKGAFPDLHYTIEDQLGENDRTVVRFTIAGTNTGSFRGQPPTGKEVRWTGITMSRHADGKVVENWIEIDMVSLLQQVGMITGTAARHAGE